MTYRGFEITAEPARVVARRTTTGTETRPLSARTVSLVQAEIDAVLDDEGGLALAYDADDVPELLGEGVDLSRFLSLAGVTTHVRSLDTLDAGLSEALAVASPEAGRRLRAAGVDRLIISAQDIYGWLATPIERRALSLGVAVEVVFPDARRVYRAHDLGRLCYLKAYLRSMLACTGPLDGQHVLEVGCSDGLTCDLLVRLGAASVDGVDMMPDVGARYVRNEQVRYQQMDGEHLQFEAGAFDITCSIATLEHVGAPGRALAEMLRVTRRGGVLYAQAGPLYYSPFGHHMFGDFDDLPWIHVRRTPAEIVDIARQRGLEARLRSERGLDCENYISGMLSRGHINGLRLSEYGLEGIRQQAGDVLLWRPSYEGQDLLTDQIAEEIRGVPRPCLTEHGFELAVRR
jgi:SAM-dependent methyltransferase